MQSNRKFVISRSLLATLVGLAQTQVDDIESGVEDGTYNAADNVSLPEQQAAVQQAEALLAEPDDQPGYLTGLLMSLDDGQSWVSSAGVRLAFHDAVEGDGGMSDLMVNVTTEGIILDVTEQGCGTVSRTACLNVDSLVSLTQ